MSISNRNAARKIDAAIRRGWHPNLHCGPGRFLRLTKAQRRMAFKYSTNSVDNRWRGVIAKANAETETA